jgi:hypothetical protein
MTKLTETQTLILSAGAQRPDNIALPLPKGLAGAAAKMAVTKMIEHGWLQEVDANLRRNEPLWRETGDGHGTTLVVTDAGLLAIGIEPVVVKTVVAIRKHAAETPTGCHRRPTQAARRDKTGDADRDVAAARRWNHGRNHGCNRMAGTHREGCHVGRLGQEAGAGRDFRKRCPSRAGLQTSGCLTFQPCRRDAPPSQPGGGFHL